MINTNTPVQRAIDSPTRMGDAAVFLDRDGTLIRHVQYLTNTEQIEILPRAAEAIRLLTQAGFRCIVVTNQSAIAKGLLTSEALDEIHAELQRRLRACDAALDAFYHCPLASAGANAATTESFERKPGPGMLLRAAMELKLDLARSWIVGDSACDVMAGWNAGCRGQILLDGALQREAARIIPPEVQYLRSRDVLEAAQTIVRDADAGSMPARDLSANRSSQGVR